MPQQQGGSMKRDSEIILDATEKMIKIIDAELQMYGVPDYARTVITNQIVDVWDTGGRHALALLRELDKAKMN
jgi:selenophosphate synthase